MKVKYRNFEEIEDIGEIKNLEEVNFYGDYQHLEQVETKTLLNIEDLGMGMILEYKGELIGNTIVSNLIVI